MSWNWHDRRARERYGRQQVDKLNLDERTDEWRAELARWASKAAGEPVNTEAALGELLSHLGDEINYLPEAISRQVEISKSQAEYRQKQAAAEAETGGYQIRVPTRPPRLVIKPGGAIVDMAEADAEGERQAAREASIAAQRASQLEDAAVNAEAARANQAARDAAFDNISPFRPR